MSAIDVCFEFLFRLSYMVKITRNISYFNSLNPQIGLSQQIIISKQYENFILGCGPWKQFMEGRLQLHTGVKMISHGWDSARQKLEQLFLWIYSKSCFSVCDALMERGDNSGSCIRRCHSITSMGLKIVDPPFMFKELQQKTWLSRNIYGSLMARKNEFQAKKWWE